jgi:hypothetical protein
MARTGYLAQSSASASILVPFHSAPLLQPKVADHYHRDGIYNGARHGFPTGAAMAETPKQQGVVQRVMIAVPPHHLPEARERGSTADNA